MSDHLEFVGRIVEGSKSIFKVQLMTEKNGRYEELDTFVQCTIGGKLRMHKIHLLHGDVVKIRVSPYDLTRGFIVYRV
jgi:translation initiation factor IF-1